MSNGLISIFAILGTLMIAGAALGLIVRSRFSLGWLVVAAVLVLLNDAALTNVYGLLPEAISGTHWNWQGKILALAVTLIVASLPTFGWRASGLTLIQRTDSLRPVLIVSGLYVAFFVAIALVFPSEPGTGEDIAFQLTMPGLEEEPFYRGILLLALGNAFRGRFHWLGIDWGWGALISCALFGLAHGFGYSDGAFSFDAITMALTAIPALLAVWLRERTGSLLLPILLHNFGNAVSFIV